MQNKTPIVVLTGLGIVAAAAVAGLTRDQWMGHAPVVATSPTPATDTGKTPDQPPVSQEQPKIAEQPGAAAPSAGEQPTQPTAPESQSKAESAAPSATQQMTAAPLQPQPDVPAAKNAGDAGRVPAFDTVRVEKTGEAVIAGTAAPGANVVVKLDGKPIGETTANADGAFVLVPSTPLPVGSGALTLEAKAKDAEQATPSQQSVAVIVPAADQPQEALVAVVSPDQPTRVLQKPEQKQDGKASPSAVPTAEKPAKLVSIDAVDYDPAGNIVFSGQGDEGNTARVYIDNAFIGDAPVGADGRWSFSATAQVTPGVHTLRVDGLDAEGKVLNRVEVPFVREEQKKVAQAAQQPADTTQPDQTPQTTQPTQTNQPSQTSQTVDTAQPAADTSDAQATAPVPAATEAPKSDTAAKSDAEPAQQPPAATEASQAKPKDGRIVIQPGNNLWRISRVLYGNGAKFTMLYEANKDQIRDPNRIYPGQVFKTPDVTPAAESVDPKRRNPLTPEENTPSGQ